MQTATSEEPERRYQTVERFSDDIRRFIDGLPIAARPATFSYRANKFVRRNKIPVIAGFLIFLSLITGIAAAMWQANAARKQAAIADQARQQAELEKEKAEKIGERYLRKSLPMFRLHYKENNNAIFLNECDLSYALAMQNKWTDFDEHFAVCKQGKAKLRSVDFDGSVEKRIGLIEKASAERDISK